MSDSTSTRFSNTGPGTATGPTLPAAARNIAPDPIDVGGVEQGKITFENWKGDADRPEPEPPAILPPGKRLGVAIIGLGRLTLNQILPAFRQSLYAKPVALVSDRPEKAREVAKQYGIDESALYRYDDIERMAENKEIDAVYVVTPNGRHRDHVLAAAKAGKHVLCEKPMANNSAEAREMIDACRQAGVKLMIAYRCQYELFNVEAARLTQSGELGRPRIIHATNTQVQGPGEQWRMRAALAGGGALPDIGLYCLNGVRTMLGEDPVEVYAQIINPEGDARYAEVEETISYTLRFPSGVIANCVTSYGAHECKDMEIRLEKGWVSLENAFAYAGQRLYVAERHGSGEQVNEIRISPKDQFTLEIDHFADSVLNNKISHTPGEEGLQDHLLMEAIYRSAREGLPVKIDHDSVHKPIPASQR
ncbi:Gfo/Idh/MocA family protein [Rouxiella chamberiensis]|uniref:Gfo/Idh/MocA family oxidoreductase n=1 Tax=Rouxiella chamberiensis TaxID=1513468 RepID=A0ABY7HQF5_9GAMM|nr:Gfo/Idh/MocA family oxidoreductase [Rouxiella chamberiensis]WAT01626.1 Gfo/Idh/MocA family oxidoreductase [Rouxiella chamberiensis]